MNIINARLRGKPGLFRIELNDERIAAIVPQAEVVAPVAAHDLDAGQNLVVAPFVEPHIHLDATLTAGEPRWNMSGTCSKASNAGLSARKSPPMKTSRYGRKGPSACWWTTESSMCAPTSM